MRRTLLASLFAVVPLALSATPAHADVSGGLVPPECVFVEVYIPQIGHDPTITVCRPWLGAA